MDFPIGQPAVPFTTSTGRSLALYPQQRGDDDWTETSGAAFRGRVLKSVGSLWFLWFLGDDDDDEFNKRQYRLPDDVDDCDDDGAEEEGVGALKIIICWHGIECRSILLVWLVGFWFLSVCRDS